MSMWKASVGHQLSTENGADDDDWETDPDFVVCYFTQLHAKLHYIIQH